MPSIHDRWCLRGPDEELCRVSGCGARALYGRLCGEHRREWDDALSDLAYEAARERKLEGF